MIINLSQKFNLSFSTEEESDNIQAFYPPNSDFALSPERNLKNMALIVFCTMSE